MEKESFRAIIFRSLIVHNHFISPDEKLLLSSANKRNGCGHLVGFDRFGLIHGIL